jgi:two-component system NtrC family sensor kinase
VLELKAGVMNILLERLGLRFCSQTLERQFTEKFSTSDLARTQIGMILGAVVYCSFSVWDYLLDPVGWRTTAAIRSAVACACLLPLTLLLSVRRMQRWAEAIYVLYCVVPGCVLSLIYLVIDRGFEHSSAGMIIIILFVSTLLPLRIGSLAIFCTLTWSCFIICELFADYLPTSIRVVNNIEIGSAYALSLYAVGAREIRARQQLIDSNALISEKERSEASLLELRKTQAQLIQAEKLASLGQLVAGVAHEVSTPLGLALTTATSLDGELKRLKSSICSGQVRRSELERSVSRLTEGMKMLFGNHNRAAELIHSFKQVAINEADEARQNIIIGQWLNDLMKTLRPILSRRGHTVVVTCEEGLVLDTYPGALAEVIRSLALNSVEHGYPEENGGEIKVSVFRDEMNDIQIVLRDNGKGIKGDDLSKVFDPFFTTGRNKGRIGLGLHIVYNLVVSTLRGTIALESEEHVGTTCTINLPMLT